MSFNYNFNSLHIQQLGFYPEFTKTQVKPNLTFFPTKPQTCPSSGVLPVPKNIFPRRGEQCPIEKCSYKGYSPPKCTCNAMYENCFRTKDFCFINHSIGLPSEKFTGQPSDQVHGITVRYRNILDNPPISKHIGQPSDIKTYWTTPSIINSLNSLKTHVNIFSMHISTPFSHNMHVSQSSN